VEEMAKKQLEDRRKMKEADELEILETEEDFKVDLSSPLILFILPENHLKYLIPDFEKTCCRASFESTAVHESMFGLGRLWALEGKFFTSLEYLKRALKQRNDDFYKLWTSVLKVKIGKDIDSEPVSLNFFQKLWCCSNTRKKNGAIEDLEKLPTSVESSWAMLEIALKGFTEVEKPEFYASRIKEQSEYFGYLAWAEVYLRRNDNDHFSSLSSSLIKKFGSRPESYVKQWKFAYYTLKDYNFAEDVISEAILRINPNNNFQYYVIFCIYLSKVYFKQKRFKECFGFLQRKFVEHPTYPVFLFQFGRLSIKSEDFRFNGAALSALQESLRLCDETRLGDIYYWLSKAFMLARLHDDAFKTATFALELLDRRKLKKINELKSFVNEIKPSMTKIENLNQLLKNEVNCQNFEQLKKICKDIQNFHKLTADVLYAKILWKANRKEEALKKLYSVCGISTVKMTGYFILLKFLKVQNNLKLMKTVASEMIGKCLNPQVPSFIWVKANLIFSKILVKLKKPGKAILLLKTLAKLLPPFPFADIRYTKALQRASSIHDLTEAHLKVIQSYNAYNFATYKNSFIDTFTNSRDFSKKLIEDEEQQANVGIGLSPGQRRQSRIVTEGFDRSFYNKKVSFDLSIDEKSSKKLKIPELRVNDNSEIMFFTVCSDSKFLYKIGKIALKNSSALTDGICAISDYIELLKFEKSRARVQRRQSKAMKVLEGLLEITRKH
jgi:tetratricopeptide (TPR) repeat protein